MINITSILILISFTLVGNNAFAQKTNKAITPVNNNLNQAQDIINGDKVINNNITIQENYGPINLNEKILPNLFLTDYKEGFEDSFYTINFKIIDKNHTDFNDFNIEIRFNDTVYYSHGNVSSNTCNVTWNSDEYNVISCGYSCKACPYNDGFFTFIGKNKKKFKIEEIISNYPIKQ